jgi:hypothetical protein
MHKLYVYSYLLCFVLLDILPCSCPIYLTNFILFLHYEVCIVIFFSCGTTFFLVVTVFYQWSQILHAVTFQR